jgi:phosphatidate cytidylyltransferase
MAAPAALVSMEVFYLLPALLLMAGTLVPLLMPGAIQSTKNADLRDGQSTSVRDLGMAALGWAYIAWLPAFMVPLARLEEGSVLLVLAGLATALSDVGAFTAGRVFGAHGRHRLAPRISPNKTWEGAAGNLAGAAIGVALTWLALREVRPETATFLLHTTVLPITIAVGAVWGDLFESAIKREFGAKDTGAWLPGFGGLLDRVDSLLFVVPLVYFQYHFASMLTSIFN